MSAETNRTADTAEDAELVNRAKRDPQQFGKLYDKYFKQIYLFIFKRTADEALAGDLTSQVFTKGMLKLQDYENKGFPFSSWLYRIASNEVAMHYRKAGKRQVITFDNDGLRQIADDRSEDFERDDSTDRLIELTLDLMQDLPPDDMRLIQLRFFDKMTFKEIGDILDMTGNNAKVRCYRLLDKLRKQLTKQAKHISA